MHGPYRIRLDIYGGTPQLAPRSPPDYGWSVDHLIESVTPETKEIVIVSPNNPVGNCIAESELRRLLELDLLVVVDEAYYEFAGTTYMPLIHEYSNFIITRTLAKAFGFAGLRLGYAITNPGLATYLTKVMHHFPVNRITAKAAIAALEDTAYLEFVIREIKKGREYLEAALNSLPNVQAYPSNTNFVLTKFSAPDASSYDITQKLIEAGIIVRDYTGKSGLDGQFVRITVGTQEQNEACVAAIKDVLSH